MTETYKEHHKNKQTETMEFVIKTFLDLRDNAVESLKGYVKDKNIPLEKRWDLFIQSDLGEINKYYFHPKGLDWRNVNLEDDFYTKKYATLTALGMLDQIDDLIKDGELIEFDEVAFKEDFLNRFSKGFINNW